MPDIPQTALQRLRDAVPAKSHPDADLLTAFAEQSLAESERAGVIEHLARCGDCRVVVALALPATEATSTSRSLSRSGWVKWPVLRWSIVAAGILAVTSVGVVQYRQHQRRSQMLLSTLTAESTTVSSAHGIQPSPGASGQQAVLRPTERINSEARRQTLTNSLSPGKPANSTAPSPKFYALRSRVSGRKAAGKEATLPLTPQSEATIASGKPISAPSSTQQNAVSQSSQMVEIQSEAAPVETAQNQAPEQIVRNRDSDVVKAKAPEPATSLSSGPSAQSAAKLSSMRAGPSIMLHGLPRWSISSAGTLQRSFDAGQTWQDVNVDCVTSNRSQGANGVGNGNDEIKVQKKVTQPNLMFRAVAAIGSEVWVGGSAAVLCHSADAGAHWARVVPISATAVLSGDVTRIEFSDAQHGSIATSTPQLWVTVDGGQTWSLQP